jgi:hypothetical protein
MGLNLQELYGQNIVEEQKPNEYSEYQPKRGYGWANTLPERQGLYDPEYEKDACGVGFAAYVSHVPMDVICRSDGPELSLTNFCGYLVTSRANQATKLSAMVGSPLW